MELKQKASITGFRVLLILNMLLSEELSKNEILEKLKINPDYALNNITKETIRLDINTLKMAGFDIKNTGKSNNYRYKINWSPIKIKLSKKEMRVLLNTKKAVIGLAKFGYVLRLYKFLEKICKFLLDEKQINELLNFESITNIDFQVLNELNALSKRKKEVLLLYNSPNSGIKEISIKLKEIKYSNKKVYITGISKDYPDKTVLRAEGIIKIIKILNHEETLKQQKNTKIIYKLKPKAKEHFNLLDEEKILEENGNYINIELEADNSFAAVQRLLSYGDDLIEIKNKETKAEYIEKLMAIRKKYMHSQKLL